MDKLKSQVWDVLSELSGETVVQLLTDWHGTDLIGEEFAEFLSDEGYMNYENEDEDEEIEEDDEDETETEIVRVYNIKWDCDDDEEVEETLPKEITLKVPVHLVNGGDDEETEFLNYLSDAITDQVEYCHFGFEYEVIEY